MSSSNDTQQDLQYGYVPTEWICITFLVLFALSTFFHTVQALYFRFWWLIPSAIFCGLLEVAGWSSRLWSSQNPFIDTAYIIGVVTLIIAPTPLVAANFIILGRIIRRLGPQYSRLTPRRYTIIFVSCDITSLVVQALGGSIASGNNASQSTLNLGSNIALGGTVFQLVAITAYCGLAAEFLFRYARDRPMRSARITGEGTRGVLDRPLKHMLYAMSIMTSFIVIRTVYRVIEFVAGWTGKVNTTQSYFVIFDGIMITLAMITLNVFHPGVFLRESDYPLQTNTDDLASGGLPKTDNGVLGNDEMRAV